MVLFSIYVYVNRRCCYPSPLTFTDKIKCLFKICATSCFDVASFSFSTKDIFEVVEVEFENIRLLLPRPFDYQ